MLRAVSTASPDLAPILLFAMLTGCRRGEICGLQWGDINWETQRLTVRRSVWQVRRSLGVKGNKDPPDSGRSRLTRTRLLC